MADHASATAKDALALDSRLSISLLFNSAQCLVSMRLDVLPQLTVLLAHLLPDRLNHLFQNFTPASRVISVPL